jgi:hypothetical protein
MLTLLLVNMPAAYAFTDEPEGFRGINWGTSLSAVREQFRASPAYTSDGIDYYVRITDELKLGTAIIDRIVYGFWQEKFYNAELAYTGYNNFIGVKDTTAARFGTPKQPYWSTPIFYWESARTGIILDHNNPGNRGKLLLYSKIIHKEKELYDKERLKQDAAKHF